MSGRPDAPWSGWFPLQQMGRPSRLILYSAIAFCGSALLAQCYVPTSSYFWSLGSGRLLLCGALFFLPPTNAGRYRPVLIALAFLALLVLWFGSQAVFAQWVLITVLYLTLEVTVDSLVIEQATEQEAPLEIGLLAGVRLSGLWLGLLVRYTNLALGLTETTLVQGLLLALLFTWLFIRERRDDRFWPTQIEPNHPTCSSQLRQDLKRLVEPVTLLTLCHLTSAALMAGLFAQTVLPYPLIYPSNQNLWFENVTLSLHLLAVGLFGTWLLEKLGLHWQLALSSAALLLLPWLHYLSLARVWPWAWGLLLCGVLLSTRLVLRETYRMRPVMRAAIIVTLWTAGGLSGEALHNLGQAGPTLLALGLSTVFVGSVALSGWSKYRRPARTIDVNKLPRSERFGDRKQDFQAGPPAQGGKPPRRLLTHLSTYLFVHLPVTILTLTILGGSLTSVYLVAKNHKRWQARVENAARVFETELFFTGFSRRLTEEMIASRQVPRDWAQFISDSFSSKGKKLTDRDPWDTPYRFLVSPKAVEIASAGPDRRFGTPDDLSRSIARPEGVQN